MKFKFLEHTADIKFQAFGNSIEEAFENSVYALASIMFKGKVKEERKKKIEIKGKDLENLLYNFLEEFLILIDSENFIVGKVKNLKIKKDEDKKDYILKCEVVGDDAGNYNLEGDVKAITYNDMFVKKLEEGGERRWVCQVVVDV